MNHQTRGWVDYALWVLIAFGLFNITKISMENLSGNPCPHVLSVPICYVVWIGYALMALSIVVWHKGCRHHFFVVGWGLAAVIALIGSIAEATSGGGVCPTSGGGSLRGEATGTGIPLCYVSLLMLLLILGLFMFGPYRRICDSADSPSN